MLGLAFVARAVEELTELAAATTGFLFTAAAFLFLANFLLVLAPGLIWEVLRASVRFL